MASLKFDITGNANGYIRATKQTTDATKSMVGSIQKDAREIDNIFKTLATGAGTFFTMQMASGFVKQVSQVRGEFQQLEVAFETMLQSKEKADALMAQVVDTAARTPFDLQGVANGAKQLLAYGVASEEVNDTLVRLGDIAAGLSIPLNDLVYLYGTTMTQGRLFTQDLRQFQGRGIPLADELAKQFGVTKDAVGELVTAGKVGFAEVQKAIMNMTNEGGKFNNLMEKQSKTITGQISNLEDAVDQMFNEIGKSSEGAISEAIGMASSLVEHYDKVGKIIGGIVVTLGSYKAATIAINTYKKASIALETADAVAKRASAASTKQVTTATVLLAKAQKALNLSMLSNPYVIAAAAVAALGLGVYALVTAKSKEERIHERVNSQLERYNANLEKQKLQLQELYDTISDSSSTDMQRAIAMDKLRELYPGILKDLSDEEILKLGVAEATKRLNEENERLLRNDLHAQILKTTKAYEDAVEKLNTYRATGSKAGLLGKGEGKRLSNDVEKYRFELEALLSAYKKIDDAAQKAEFLALPADQKIVSLKQSNAELDEEIIELDKKLAELRKKKNQAKDGEPTEFALGSLSGALYEGGMTEEELLEEIRKKREQQKANEKDIEDNQKKIDEQNKALTDKQRKAAYDRKKAEQKAAEDLAKMKVDLNNRIAQADIDSMEDGYNKVIKQLEHNLDLEEQAIEQKKKDLLKKKENDALQNWLAEDPENRKAYDFKYKAELTPEELEMFRQMGDLAQRQFNRGREDADKKFEHEASFFKRELEISAMAEGADKDKAQRELENEKELHQLELQRDAYIEAARAAYLFAEQKKAADDPFYVMELFDVDKANAEFDALLENYKKKQSQQQLDSEIEAWQNYYIEYGNFKEKLWHLEQQYNDKIAKAKTDGEKASLIAERDKVLDELKKSKDAAYQNIFKDPTKMSLSSVKDAIKLAREEIKKIITKGILNESDIENVQRLQEAIDRLQSHADSAPFDGFGDGLDGVVAKLNQIRIIKKKIDDAEKTGDLKAKKAAEDELVANKEVLRKNLAGVGVDAFANGLNQAADAMARIAEISGDPQLKETADILNGTVNVISSTATGAAAGGWIGAIVGGVTAILGEATNAAIENAAALAINQKAWEDYEINLRLMAASINEDVYESIFGENVWAKIEHFRENIEKAKDLFKSLNEQAFKTTEVFSEPVPINTAWLADDVPLENVEVIYQTVGKVYKALGDATIKAKGSNKKQYSGTLSSIFPDIFDENGNLKLDQIDKAKEALATLKSMELKDDQGVALLDNAIQAAEKLKEAEDKLKEAAEDYMGNIGNSLGDAIVNGILRGEDALENFGDVAGGIIEQIAKDFASSWMIENYLKNFEDDMQNAFLSGDSKEITGIVQSIVAGLPNVLDAAETATKEILDMTKGTDYDLYEKAAESNRTSSAKGTVQASQDSVDEVKGIAANIQSHTFSIHNDIKQVVNINSQILSSVRNIESNTDRLISIESDLSQLRSDMSDMVTKGIKVRA